MKRRTPYLKIGLTFASFEIVGLADKGGHGSHALYACRCSCGNVVNKRKNAVLKTPEDATCGHCIVHLSGSTEAGRALYMVWYSMVQRCHHIDDEDPLYERYRGRGIKVWKKWRNDKVRFARWALRNGWQLGLEIDRIDNDGNYKPSNCRFVNRKTNLYNRECSKLVAYGTKKLRPFKDIVDQYGVVSYGTAFQRYYKQGWDLHDALTTPARKGNYR